MNVPLSKKAHLTVVTEDPDVQKAFSDGKDILFISFVQGLVKGGSGLRVHQIKVSAIVDSIYYENTICPFISYVINILTKKGDRNVRSSVRI